jgi:DNA-binding NtrC family response regulator
MDASNQVILVERLAQVTNDPIHQRALPHTVVGVSRDQSGRDGLSRSHELAMQLEPRYPRHLHVRDQTGVQPIKGGAIEFLTKPFRDQDLLDAIELGLARDRAWLENEEANAALRERFETLTPREREVMALVVMAASTSRSPTTSASARSL